MKLQPKIAAGLKLALSAASIVLLPVLAIAAWRFVFAPYVSDNGTRTFTSPLPTITARISPTPRETVRLNVTQTSDADFVATKEAGLTFARQTAEAAKLVIPDPTQLFRKLHPSAIAWPTPDLSISRPAFGGTPAGAGSITRIIPPFCTREYGIENSWREVTDSASKITYVPRMPDPKCTPWSRGLDQGSTLSKRYYVTA